MSKYFAVALSKVAEIIFSHCCFLLPFLCALKFKNKKSPVQIYQQNRLEML